jgi:hypothetical protein
LQANRQQSEKGKAARMAAQGMWIEMHRRIISGNACMRLGASGDYRAGASKFAKIV